MAGKLSYSMQIGDWCITTEIDTEVVYSNWERNDGGIESVSYPATITIASTTAYTPMNERVTLTEQHQVTLTEQDDNACEASASGSDSDLVYEVVNTVGGSSSMIRVAVDGETANNSKPVYLPRVELLVVLERIRRHPEMTGAEMVDVISEVYPQDTTRTAVNRFERDLEMYLPPEDYLPIVNMLIDGCPKISGYRDPAGVYIAKHGFELLPMTYPNGDDDQYIRHIRLYNSQSNLPDTNTEDVLRAALFRAFDYDGDTDTALARIKRGIPGESWDDGLCNANVWVLCALLHGDGNEDKAKTIAESLPQTVSIDEYDSEKQKTRRAPDEDQSYYWGRLLPTAARSSVPEYRHVLGNLTYWLAGDLNTQHNELEHASRLYEIAESLLRAHGSEAYSEAAWTRQQYTKGLHDLHESREDDALTAFSEVINASGTVENTVIDVYSVYGSIEQAVKLLLSNLYNDTTGVEKTLEKLEWIDEKMPYRAIAPSPSLDRYDNLDLLVQSALAEVTARKLERMQSPDTAVPTDEQVLSQYETAVEGYAELNMHWNRRTVESRIDEFNQRVIDGSSDARNSSPGGVPY